MENLAQKNFMRIVTMYLYIIGMPYFWFEELQWSPTVVLFRNYMTRATSIINYIFISMMWFLPLFTQNLDAEQVYNFLTYNFVEPILYASTIWMWYFRKEVTELIQELVVYAPTICCDSGVQARMLKKAKTFVFLILSCMAITMSTIGIQGALRVHKNELFITIITAWPDLEDRSQTAGMFRVLTYIAWWMLLIRISGALAIVLCLMSYTSHQFIQLQNYFYSLAHIFKEDLLQSEKERKYEEALKIGFKFHSDIIRLTRKLVKTCNVLYGGEIITNVVAIAVIMIRIANEERTLIHILVNAQIAVTVLITTGFFIWNLGDITIEADNLTRAMYMSGWENCYGRSSLRVRKLLLVAMAQTQNPLKIKALGVITVSYSSFVSIVKFSYSVFSVVV